jgi:hypothetical protein
LDSALLLTVCDFEYCKVVWDVLTVFLIFSLFSFYLLYSLDNKDAVITNLINDWFVYRVLLNFISFTYVKFKHTFKYHFPRSFAKTKICTN